MTDFDLEKILRVYIDHIGEQEGIDFINRGVGGLTDEEMDELKRIAGYPEQCVDVDYDKHLITVKSPLDALSFLNYLQKRLPDMVEVTEYYFEIDDWSIEGFTFVQSSEYSGYSIKGKGAVYVCATNLKSHSVDFKSG